MRCGVECAKLIFSSTGGRQPALGMKQISSLEYFSLAQGQVHSLNWIFAADCQGKVVSSLNMVFLQKEEVRRVASSALKSGYRLSNETVLFILLHFP